MLKMSEDMWVIMTCNLHAGSMKPSRHNIFEQNSCLMKISVKKCCPLGLPSQQGIDKTISYGHNKGNLVSKLRDRPS
jgi:hypothetical protein